MRKERNEENMKVHITSKYLDREVELLFTHYDRNNSIVIEGRSFEGEPEFVATVCLPDEKLVENHVFLKGWSENEGIPEALAKAGVVRLTGRKVRAGFCEAIEAEILVPSMTKKE